MKKLVFIALFIACLTSCSNIVDTTNCPVTIELLSTGPTETYRWDFTAKVTNNSEKTIRLITFKVNGVSIDGEVTNDRNCMRNRWNGHLEPGKTTTSGSWLLTMQKEMQKGKFSARNIKVYFTDGTTWPSSDPFENDLLLSELLR